MKSPLRSMWHLLQEAWFGLRGLFSSSVGVLAKAVDRARPTTSRGLHQWRAVGSSVRWSAFTAITAVLATHLTVVVSSEAAWVDQEWVQGDLATLNCESEDGFTTRAAGRLLGGGLLPLDLDTIATVSGVTVTNDGQQAHPDPATAAGAGPDVYVNPIDVSALGLVELPLTGGPLDDLLALDLANDLGVLNQYARAHGTGHSQGASGVVNDSGVVQTDNDDNGSTPALGTLRLSTLVERLTGQAISQVVAGVADLELQIGAVAGRATLDGCGMAWDGNIDSHVERTYAIAGLTAAIDAPVVAGLSGTLTSAVDGLETALNGLAGNSGVVAAITTGVGGLLNGVLGTLKLGNTAITGPTIDIDLSAVRNLATATVSDDHGTVVLDVATGAVRIDLASLMGLAYGGEGFNGTQAHGLNGLPPNTELVVNGAVTNALVAALTQALDNWVADVITAITDAVYAADVDAQVVLRLGGEVLGGPVDVASVIVTVNGTLRELLDGDAEVSAALSLLGGTCRDLLQTPLACLISALVNPLVSGITGALTSGVGPLVGGVLDQAVFGEGALVPQLGATVSAATAPVVTVLADLLVGFLGVDGLVSLRANLQNDPAAGSGPSPALTYPDWEGGSQRVPEHRYDVAALGIGVLNALGADANVNLELARASVGANCVIGGVWDQQGLCHGY